MTFGAEVIKVEPAERRSPAGSHEHARKCERTPGPIRSWRFPIGASGITLDLSTDAGRGLLLELAATADVFLTSYLPAVRRKLGIELADLRAADHRSSTCADIDGGPRVRCGTPAGSTWRRDGPRHPWRSR